MTLTTQDVPTTPCGPHLRSHRAILAPGVPDRRWLAQATPYTWRTEWQRARGVASDMQAKPTPRRAHALPRRLPPRGAGRGQLLLAFGTGTSEVRHAG